MNNKCDYWDFDEVPHNVNNECVLVHKVVHDANPHDDCSINGFLDLVVHDAILQNVNNNDVN